MVDTAAQQYANSFDGDVDSETGRKAKALAFALDVRKFEIELYWKRAAYFWAFAGASFAAYIAVLGAKDMENRPRALLLVCCLGLVFATAWYFVNRASKHWQLNWEFHVDVLEESVMGNIYKTVLHENPSFWSIASSYPFSVSKINQLLSLFVVSIFALLLFDTLVQHFPLSANWKMFPTACVVLTALAILLFFVMGTVGSKNSNVTATLRSTTITSYEEQGSSPGSSAGWPWLRRFLRKRSPKY